MCSIQKKKKKDTWHYLLLKIKCKHWTMRISTMLLGYYHRASGVIFLQICCCIIILIKNTAFHRCCYLLILSFKSLTLSCREINSAKHKNHTGLTKTQPQWSRERTTQNQANSRNVRAGTKSHTFCYHWLIKIQTTQWLKTTTCCLCAWNMVSVHPPSGRGQWLNNLHDDTRTDGNCRSSPPPLSEWGREVGDLFSSPLPDSVYHKHVWKIWWKSTTSRFQFCAVQTNINN